MSVKFKSWTPQRQTATSSRMRKTDNAITLVERCQVDDRAGVDIDHVTAMQPLQGVLSLPIGALSGRDVPSTMGRFGHRSAHHGASLRVCSVRTASRRWGG